VAVGSISFGWGEACRLAAIVAIGAFYSLLGPRTIFHSRLSYRWVLSGMSQPCSAKVSAKAAAVFRFRLGRGPYWQMSSTRTVGLVQRFIIQSSTFD
jgi:hypothetical protein